MKKLLFIILTLMLLIGIQACNDNKKTLESQEKKEERETATEIENSTIDNTTSETESKKGDDNMSSGSMSNENKIMESEDSGIFYVAVNGNDKNPGTLDKPFKTLDAAKEAVRDYLERTPELKKDIYVYIRGGVYISYYSFMFMPEDSGRDGKNIIYSGYKDEEVYISSGIVLEKWINTDNEFSEVKGVYKTKLPEDANDIFCLYEDNQRAYPARHPNMINGENQYLRLMDRTSAASLQAKINKKELPSGADYKYAQMVLWAGSHNNGQLQYDWYSSVDPIKRYNETAGAFELYLGTWWDMTVGNRYYIQNVKKFIDNKGEFFYNKGTKELYYKPYGDINNANIIATTRVTNIYFSGEPNERVKNIVLRKLNICNSNFSESFSSRGDALTYEGMIKLENTSNITIDNCHLFNSGYNAVSMWGYNENNNITNCLIENCGIGGIYIGMEYDQLPYNFDDPKDGQISRNNLVENNIIRSVGQCSPGHGYGIFLHQSGYNTVTHNTFYNIPKAAVNLYNKQTGYLNGTVVGGAAVNDNNQDNYKYCRGNEISFNDIFDVMKDGADCGGIITYGVGRENVLNNNFLHDYEGIEGGLTMGIYLDDNSDGVAITNNVVARIGGSYWINGAMLKGRDITLINNIFYNTRATHGVISTMITRVATWGMPQERTHGLVCKDNIVYEDKSQTYLYCYWGFNYQYPTIKEQDNNTYFFVNNPNVNPEARIICYYIYEDGKQDTWEIVTFKKHKENCGNKTENNISWGDPLFTDSENNNFTLKSNSPSLPLGFKQIKLDDIGIDMSAYPYKSAAREAEEASGVKNKN